MTLGLAGPVFLVQRVNADVVITTRDLTIPTSSGSYVRGDLYRAQRDATKRLPTIVVYFPYNKDDSSRFERPFLARAAAAGFAALIVDVPGTGASPGAFSLLSSDEIRAGYDVVEWAARQPWSSGRVGMWGYSYPGITAAMVATLRPPHLRAIVPAAAFSDGYRDVFAPGGMRASQDAVALGALFATKTPFMRVENETPPADVVPNTTDALANPTGVAPMVDALLHPLYDGFWQERALENKVARIQVPALFWTGWDDIYPRAETLDYLDAGSKEKALVVGPWGHIGGTGDAPYEFLIQESLRWFNAYLRSGTPKPRAGMPRVRLFDIDRTSAHVFDATWKGEWRSFDAWPPPHRELPLELCGASTLAPTCAGDGAATVVGVPVEATGGISVLHDTAKGAEFNALNDAKDQRANPTATAFTGAVLTTPLVISGPLEADLWATTDGTDAGWVTRVVDVGPDDSHVIAQGWLKASHRHEDTTRRHLWHTHDAAVPVTPGEPYRLRIEIWPTSYRIPAGHRLRLLIQASDTMKVAPSLGAVRSQILVGPAHPSRLLVPERTAPGRPFRPLAGL